MRLIKLDTEKQIMTLELRDFRETLKNITIMYNDIETITYKIVCDDDILEINLKNGVKLIYDSYCAGRVDEITDFEKHFDNIGEFVKYLLIGENE